MMDKLLKNKFMKISDKNRNLSEFGPWYLSLDPIQNLADKTAHLKDTIEEPLRTQRTIKLPRIEAIHELGRSSKKLGMKMSKQSLQLPAQHHTQRIREQRMTGSVLQFYKNKGKGKQSVRYQSMSVDLGPRQFQRKLSTVQVGQPLEKQQTKEKSQRCSLNAEAAKKRCLYSIIRQINANQAIRQLYAVHKTYR